MHRLARRKAGRHARAEARRQAGKQGERNRLQGVLPRHASERNLHQLRQAALAPPRGEFRPTGLEIPLRGFLTL
jgi:hypothetical protein